MGFANLVAKRPERCLTLSCSSSNTALEHVAEPEALIEHRSLISTN